jgi:hypothetical protein
MSEVAPELRWLMAFKALGYSVAPSGLQILYGVRNPGLRAYALALGFIRLPLRGKHDKQPTRMLQKSSVSGCEQLNHLVKRGADMGKPAEAGSV